MKALWQKVPLGFRNAPAVTALAKRLGRTDARLLLIDLWEWARTYTPKGNGILRSPEAVYAVERGAGWTGKRGAFVEAAMATGWLRVAGPHDVVILPWQHVIGSLEWVVSEVTGDEDEENKRRARERQQKARAAKRASVTSRDDACDMPVTDAVTSCDGAVTERDTCDDSGVNGASTARAHARETGTSTETSTDTNGQMPTAPVAVAPVAAAVGSQTPLFAASPATPPAKQKKPKGPPVVAPSPDVNHVWSYFQERVSPDSVLTAERVALIDRWLKPTGPYDVAALKRTIDGYRVSPHHNGVNSTGTKYRSLELWFRDAKHIEDGWGITGKAGVDSFGRPVEPERPRSAIFVAPPMPTPEQTAASSASRDRVLADMRARGVL